jgi:hypothetical protein
MQPLNILGLKRANEMRRNAILKKMPSYFAEVVIFCGYFKHSGELFYERYEKDKGATYERVNGLTKANSKND